MKKLLLLTSTIVWLISMEYSRKTAFSGFNADGSLIDKNTMKYHVKGRKIEDKIAIIKAI